MVCRDGLRVVRAGVSCGASQADVWRRVSTLRHNHHIRRDVSLLCALRLPLPHRLAATAGLHQLDEWRRLGSTHRSEYTNAES